MKNALKKSLALIVVLGMVLPYSGTVFGAAEAQGTANILATQDFEGERSPSDGGQDIYVSQSVSGTETNGNKMAVWKSFAGTEAIGELGRLTFLPSVFSGLPKKYLISFDIKLLSQQAVRFYIWDDQNKAIGNFICTANGKLAFMTTAATPDMGLAPTESTSNYGVTNYDIDKWTSVDMMFDTETKKISYYANGKHLCDADIPASAGAYPKIFLAQMSKAASSENFVCFDNIKVSQPSETTFYAAAALNGENITVEFSETPVVADLSQIEVSNTETGAVITTGVPVLKGKLLTIPYSGVLSSATEHCVKLPEDLRSVTGYAIYNDRAYFMSNVSGGISNTDFFEEFTNYSTTDNHFEIPTGWFAYKHGGAGLSKLLPYSDEAHPKALEIYTTANTDIRVSKNFSNAMNSEFTVSFDFKPIDFNDYVTGDNSPLGLDLYILAGSGNNANASTLSENMYIYLPTTTESADKQSTAGSLNGGLPWVMRLWGNRIQLPRSSDYVSVEKGKWYNISITMKPGTGKLSASVKEEGSSAPATALDEVTITEFVGIEPARLTFWTSWVANRWLDTKTITYTDSNGQSQTYTHSSRPQYVIDNVKVEYTAPEFKINKVRLYDVYGENFGPLQTASSIVKTAKLYFSEEIADQSAINSENIKISDGVNNYRFSLVSYDNCVATIEFDSFLKKGERYTITTTDDVIYAKSGTELKAYRTTFDLNATGIYDYDYSINGSGDVIREGLIGSNTLAASGYVVNTTEDGEKLDVTVAAYKTVDDSVEMLDMDERLFDAYASYYDDSDSPSITVAPEGTYYVKAFTVNVGDYTPATAIKARQAGDYKLYAEAVAKKDKKLYIDIRDSQGASVYKDVRIPAQDGTEVFNIAIASATPTDNYTAKIYNDADMTVSTIDFVYANPIDTVTAVQSINAANGNAELIKTAITTGSNELALGLSADMQSKMDIDQTIALLVDWNAKPGNTLTAVNAAEVLNQLVAITVVDDEKTNNLFAEYSDELKVEESDIKDFCKDGYLTAEKQLIVQEAVTEDLKNGNYTAVDAFYDRLNEKFVLAMVENADGYENAKDVIVAFKADIVGSTTTLSEATYIYIANKSFDSFTELGTALTEYEATLETDPPSGGGGGGGGGGITSNIPDTAVSDGKPIGGSEEGKDNSINLNIFDDLGSVDWARRAIVYLAEMGIVAGKSEKHFAPNDNVLREELTKILVGAFIEDAEEAEITFGDVASNAWYAPFIKKAFGAGIINGYNTYTFGIGDNITREDMAVMVYNSAKKAGMAFETKEFEPFSDDEQISDYAKEAVYSLRNEGVINGIDLSNFAPKAFATRAEAAKIIYSLLKF